MGQVLERDPPAPTIMISNWKGARLGCDMIRSAGVKQKTKRMLTRRGNEEGSYTEVKRDGLVLLQVS
jgi:hypothetical protein